MPAGVSVKVCGLSTVADIEACVAAHARYVGFMFFAKSPRNLSLAQARGLAVQTPVGLAKVAVIVNADDAFLDALTAAVPLDMLQLHGAETPARVVEIRARYGLPVMKAVGVGDADDLPELDRYAAVADQLLVETKPARDAVLPGGNGLTFDWRLVAGRRWPVPWMLAGGLTPGNAAEAIAMSGTRQVDVSSGVESTPGVKDAGLIGQFCAAALS